MVMRTSAINREIKPAEPAVKKEKTIEAPGGRRRGDGSRQQGAHSRAEGTPLLWAPLKYFKIHERAYAPVFATEGSACFDIHALIHHGVIEMYDECNRKIQKFRHFSNQIPGVSVPPNYTALIPTGLILDIPTKYVVKIYSRSSTPLKRGLLLANGVGIIDSDYTDELFLLFRNVGNKDVIVFDGDKLAQGELCLTWPHSIEEVKKAPVRNTSRTGGMGSTGV